VLNILLARRLTKVTKTGSIVYTKKSDYDFYYTLN